jgi:hypothetical protein
MYFFAREKASRRLERIILSRAAACRVTAAAKSAPALLPPAVLGEFEKESPRQVGGGQCLAEPPLFRDGCLDLPHCLNERRGVPVEFDRVLLPFAIRNRGCVVAVVRRLGSRAERLDVRLAAGHLPASGDDGGYAGRPF